MYSTKADASSNVAQFRKVVPGQKYFVQFKEKLQARRDAAIEKRGGQCKLVNTESAFVSVTTVKGAESLMTRK